MAETYVALLRAIANTPMAPFREAMEGLGFSRVASVGMSGNLIFTAEAGAARDIERAVADRFGTDAFIRTRAEMKRASGAHPYRGQGEAVVMFLAQPPSAAVKKDLAATEFEGVRPILVGRALHFVYPVRIAGRKTHADLERLLGVRGTARTIGIVDQIVAKMAG